VNLEQQDLQIVARFEFQTSVNEL